MSRRYTGIGTTEPVKIANGTTRSMANASGNIKVSNDPSGSPYALRAAGKDFFCPLNKDTYVLAVTGTVDVEVIE